MELPYYEKLIEADEAEDREPLNEEFEDTGDPMKPFRTEYAFESITQRGSRFRKNRTEY